MFKRQNRLPRGVEFYNSRVFPTALFVLKVKQNDLEINRFGIVVSKKIDKRAVIRNKIKRMLRKIIMDLNKKMTIGHDMLFIVRIGIINNNYNQSSIIVRQVLEKAGLINSE